MRAECSSCLCVCRAVLRSSAASLIHRSRLGDHARLGAWRPKGVQFTTTLVKCHIGQLSPPLRLYLPPSRMAERQREELRRVGADIALHGRQAARGSPTHGSLTILEDYAMDTGGYIILRGAISPAEAAALAGEPVAAVERQLAGNETVAECVEGLCGAGWRQDGPLALLPEVKASRGLGGRVGAVDNARAYTEPRGAGSWTRLCQGVKVFWALADCDCGRWGRHPCPPASRAIRAACDSRAASSSFPKGSGSSRSSSSSSGRLGACSSTCVTASISR